MALIKCPDCGKMFSEFAGCCPQCGCPVEAAKAEHVTITSQVNNSTKAERFENEKNAPHSMDRDRRMAVEGNSSKGNADTNQKSFASQSSNNADGNNNSKLSESSSEQYNKNEHGNVPNEKGHQKERYLLWGLVFVIIAVLGCLVLLGYIIYGNQDLDSKKDSISVSEQNGTSSPGEMIVASVQKEYTDLGLSVFWSNYNIGASTEYDSGGLYGWGNTHTELSQDLSQYPCTNPPYSIIGTKYDVAKTLWGGDWRMPTLAELEELKDSCTWKIVEITNVTFCKVIGPNGNSILLPLDGYRKGDELKSKGEWGFIWSAELYEGNSQYAANLTFSKKGQVSTSGYYRYGGESIRPVMDKR